MLSSEKKRRSTGIAAKGRNRKSIQKITWKCKNFSLDKYPTGVYHHLVEVMPVSCEKCEERKKLRSEEEYKSLSNRLNRIAGQVKGLQKMLQDNAYCPDILIQVSAVTSALNAFSRELLGSHIRTCVTEDILSGKKEAADDLVNVLQKILK